MACDIHAYVEFSYTDRPTGDWSYLCEYQFGRNYVLFALMAGVRRYDIMPSAEHLENELTKRGVATLNDPRLSDAETDEIVRAARDNGITKGVPSFEAKGCPRDLSYKVNIEWSEFIVEDDNDMNEPGYIQRSKAEERLAKGYIEAWEIRDEKIMRVTNSDWHTPSWMNTVEVGILATRFRETLSGYVDEALKRQEYGIKWASADLRRALAEGDEEAINAAQAELERQKKWSTHNPLCSDVCAKVEALHALMTSMESNDRFKARLVFWFDN